MALRWLIFSISLGTHAFAEQVHGGGYRALKQVQPPISPGSYTCPNSTVLQQVQYAYDASPKCYNYSGAPPAPSPPPSLRADRPDAPPRKGTPPNWVLPPVIDLPSPPPGTPISDDYYGYCPLVEGVNDITNVPQARPGAMILPTLPPSVSRRYVFWVCPGFGGVYCQLQDGNGANISLSAGSNFYDQPFALATENCDFTVANGNAVAQVIRCTPSIVDPDTGENHYVVTFYYYTQYGGGASNWHDEEACTTTAQCYYPVVCLNHDLATEAAAGNVRQGGRCQWPVPPSCIGQRQDGRRWCAPHSSSTAPTLPCYDPSWDTGSRVGR